MQNPLGAKNNDSPSQKQAIVKFYIMEYRKCGNFNSKNDNRQCMGASAFLKSDDFRAFEVNVKTIALGKYLYQSGHAIWWYREPSIIDTFMEAYDFSGKTVVPFATSGGSSMGSSSRNMQDLAPKARVLEGRRFAANAEQTQLAEWLNSLNIGK